MDRWTRRSFLKGCLAGLASASCTGEQATGGSKPAAGPAPPKTATPAPPRGPIRKSEGPGRVVVLGFDGVDPRIVERGLTGGWLPNLAALAKAGSFQPLGSTSPPNSPVAWSTFATGLPPTEHGVFGFLRRDPATYLPGTAPYTIDRPRYPRDGTGKYQPASARSRRQGTDFWLTLDQARVPVTLLFVPYVFPPPALEHGRVFSGLGAPDLRFTNSSFTRFTSASAPAGGSDRVAGGRIVRLAVTGSVVDTVIQGVRGPGGDYLAAPLRLELDRDRASLALICGDTQETLQPGRRSGWFPVRFAPAGAPPLRGHVRFHLLSLKPELELYASPIQLDPEQPALPLGHPAPWVVEAAKVHGGLPTVGWVHDTSAVNAGALPPAVFLADLLDTMEGRTKLLERELAAGAARVLVSVFTGTDRAAHIFWRETERPDAGAVGRVYKAMDQIVGRVRGQLRPDDRLLVLSDHGFHPFERMLHVNTWLERAGWFTRAEAGAPVRFLRGVDWAKTRAFSLGNGQVYANLAGREAQGSVAAGPARDKLLAAIRERLLGLKDPLTGEQVVRNVYPVADQAAAAVRAAAPDLQIAFTPGYRSSWETSLGHAPTGEILAANPKAWCGDHAASDRPETPGILFADRPLAVTDPDLLDLAPTLLALGGTKPATTGGRLLFG